MAILKCKVCGGDLGVSDGASVVCCAYCGTSQTVSLLADAPRALHADSVAAEGGIAEASSGQGTMPKVSPMVTRGNLALEDGDYAQAKTFFERALNLEPENAHAYLGKFLARYRAPSLDALKDRPISYEDDADFSKAHRFAEGELRATLSSLIAASSQRKAEAEEAERQLNARLGEVFIDVLENSSRECSNAQSTVDKLSAEDLKRCGYPSARALFEKMNAISSVLSCRDYLSMEELLKRANVRKRDDSEARGLIERLASCGALEKRQDNQALYGLVGVGREKEQSLLAQKRRHAARERINAEVQAELQPCIEAIEARYAPLIGQVKTDMGSAESSRGQHEVQVKLQLSQTERERDALGFFDRTQKAVCNERIAALKTELRGIPSAEVLRAPYLERLDELATAQEAEIFKAGKEVRARHPLPDLEYFLEEVRKEMAC